MILGSATYTPLNSGFVTQGFNGIPQGFRGLHEMPGYPNAILFHPHKLHWTINAHIQGVSYGPTSTRLITGLPKLMIFAPHVPYEAISPRLNPAACQNLQDLIRHYGLNHNDIKRQLVVQNAPFNLTNNPHPIYRDLEEARRRAPYQSAGPLLLRTHYAFNKSPTSLTERRSFEEKYTFDTGVFPDSPSQAVYLEGQSSSLLRDQVHKTHNIPYPDGTYSIHMASPDNTALKGLTLDSNGLIQDSLSFTTIVVYKKYQLNEGGTPFEDTFSKPHIYVVRHYILNELHTLDLNHALYEAHQGSFKDPPLEEKLEVLHQRIQTRLYSIPLAQDFAPLIPQRRP